MNEVRRDFPACGNKNDCRLSFRPEDYRGKGSSEGLSRGILVFSEGRNLTGEGMGIGSIALRRRGFTYFSSRHRTAASGDDSVERIFCVDTWRKWAIHGYPSTGLTRFIELTADCYMALPLAQPVLGIQSPLRRALTLHPSLEQISPLCRAGFRYSFKGQDIFVSCTIESYGDDLPRIFILNELDSEFFCRSFFHGRSGPPPSGWSKCPDHACLSSQDGTICFQLEDISVDSSASWRLFWGREQTDTLHWAGFEIRIDPLPETRRIDCSYTACFRRCIGGEEG